MSRILASVAYPDDTELSCWGSLLARKTMGLTLGLVIASSGELGARFQAAGPALAQQPEAWRFEPSCPFADIGSLLPPPPHARGLGA